MTTKQFKFDDCVARNKQHPDTFEIHSQEKRDSVPVGAFVKLIFMTGLDEGPEAERMWVKVTGRTNDGVYTGTLANDPVFIDAEYGDTVTFEAHHIADILPEEA